MADNPPQDGSHAQARPAARGKTKAQKKQTATEINPYLHSYEFTDAEDPDYQKKFTSSFWQAGPSDSDGERVLPRPPWATLIWGPLPLQEGKGYVKKVIKPGSGGGRKKVEVGEPTDDEVRNVLYQAWSKSMTKVKGSRNLVVLKTSDLGPAQVVPYLGFPDHGALAAFALTEGLALFGPLWQEWSTRVGGKFISSPFPLQQVFDLINQQPSDGYFMTLVSEIDGSRSYIPLVLSKMLDPSSSLLDTIDESREVCMIATTVLYAYRTLKWMTKGPEFDGQNATAAWAEYAQRVPVEDDEESLLGLFDTDLLDPMRFRCDKRSKEELQHHYGDEAHDAILDRFLGYSREDWRNILPEEFVPNPFLAGFAGGTAPSFLQATHDATSQPTGNAPAGAEPGADADATFSYSLSTLTAGLPPQNVDFEEAMNLVGLEGEDRKTYALNAKNTRITKKAARNLSNAAHQTKAPATGVTGQDDQEDNLREAFTLLPHQIAEAKIINDYITGPIPCFMLGAEIGLGKTITFELSWHVRARQLKQEAANAVPDDQAPRQTYGPHLLVTPGDLVDAMVADCQSAFRGIREYIIINSTSRSSIPGAKVYSTAADVVAFMQTVYDRRHDPKVMDTTIVIGYQLFAKRLLESDVKFDLVDGQLRVDTTLAKRPKGQRSTIDWHHTRKVLMHSYGEAQGFTPPSKKSQDRTAKMGDSEDVHESEDASEFEGRDDENASDDYVPGSSQPRDNVKAFLKAYNEALAAAEPDSPATGPSTPSAKHTPKVPRVSVKKAIAAIMEEMRGSFDSKGSGVFDPACPDLQDVETGSGSIKDRRQTLSFGEKGTQMLRLHFESLNLRTGQDILEWYVSHQDQMPIACHRVYHLGSGWFPVDLMKAGKWPEMGRVTFDEAHMLRNLDSTFYIAARLVPARELLLATGTPQFNGTRDVLAYASLFAARSGLDQYFIAQQRGSECSEVIKDVKTSQEVVTNGWVGLQQEDTSQFVESLHEWANQDLARRQWWCLLRSYRTTIGWRKKTTVAGTFLSSFISLRRMKTPLQIGDQVIYPGASLPECRIRTVEVSLHPANSDCHTLQHLVSAAVKYMYTTLDLTDSSDRSQSAKGPVDLAGWQRAGGRMVEE